MAAHPAPYLCDGRTDGWTDRQTNCVPTKTRTDTNELAFCCPFGGRHSLGAHLNASRNNGERRAGHLVSFRDHYQNISPKRPARCRHATQRNTTQHKALTSAPQSFGSHWSVSGTGRRFSVRGALCPERCSFARSFHRIGPNFGPDRSQRDCGPIIARRCQHLSAISLNFAFAISRPDDFRAIRKSIGRAPNLSNATHEPHGTGDFSFIIAASERPVRADGLEGGLSRIDLPKDFMLISTRRILKI